MSFIFMMIVTSTQGIRRKTVVILLDFLSCYLLRIYVIFFLHSITPLLHQITLNNYNLYLKTINVEPQHFILSFIMINYNSWRMGLISAMISIRKINFFINTHQRCIYLQRKQPSFKMKVQNLMKQLLRKCDLFSTSQFLRYRDDQDYKTASGGICSLMVITIFMVLFMNTALQTIDMTNITWTSTSEILFDPTQTNITITNPSDGSNPFMFAINIMGVNLNNNNSRFFDVSLIQHHIIRGGIEVASRNINMVQCTADHFSVNQAIQKSYHTLPTSRWLCPPLDYTFGLHGKYTSETMEFIEIKISKCNSTLDPSRPCAPTSVIDAMEAALGQFSAALFYINPLINPGDQNYLSYYLQDRNYVTFTRELGAYSNGFIEDYQIDTDISLLPTSQNVVDTGVVITQLFQSIVYQVTGNDYASFYLLKSSKSTTYSRQFTKLDSFFSYVGGLVGTILGLMLVVSKFTQFAFEMDISQKLFWYKDDQENDFSNANILTYIVYLFYGIFSRFECCNKQNWKGMKQYHECRQQIVKQLNVDYIISKISFLQNAVQSILDENQLEGLYFQKYDTLSKIKKRRRKYKIKAKYIKHQKEQEQEKEKEQRSSDSDNGSHESKSFNLRNRVGNSSMVQMNDSITKPIQSAIGEVHRGTVQIVFQQAKDSNSKRFDTQSLYTLKKQSQSGDEVSKRILKGVISELEILNEQQQIKPSNKIRRKGTNQTETVKVESQNIQVGQFLFLN